MAETALFNADILPPRLVDPQSPLGPQRTAGMPAGEGQIWINALPALRDRYRSLWYNVRLGGQSAYSASWSPAVGRMASDLSAYRIDVVGDAGDHWDLIEVKDRSSLAAVGQLLGYQIIWRRNPPDDRPTRLIFVAPHITPELSIVLAELGIGAVIAPT